MSHIYYRWFPRIMIMTKAKPDDPTPLSLVRDIPRHAIVIIGLVCLLALLGGLATPLGPWYYGLVQPSWKAPDYLFGPAWTIIFGLAAYAAIKAWGASQTASDRKRIALIFGINGLLNLSWSLLFFALQRPDWALMEVGLLWLSIVAMMLAVRPLAPIAAQALIPYLVWVTYAAILNAAVVSLNAPFG